MPICVWIALGVAILVAILVKISWKDNFVAFGFGAIAGLSLLLVLMISNILITGYVRERANEEKAWEVVCEEELIQLTEEDPIYLVVENEQNSAHKQFVYQTKWYDGTDSLNNTEHLVKIIDADFVTPALVTEEIVLDTWWADLFLFNKTFNRYTFVLGEHNILNVQTY